MNWLVSILLLLIIGSSWMECSEKNINRSGRSIEIDIDKLGSTVCKGVSSVIRNPCGEPNMFITHHCCDDTFDCCWSLTTFSLCGIAGVASLILIVALCLCCCRLCCGCCCDSLNNGEVQRPVAIVHFQPATNPSFVNNNPPAYSKVAGGHIA